MKRTLSRFGIISIASIAATTVLSATASMASGGFHAADRDRDAIDRDARRSWGHVALMEDDPFMLDPPCWVKGLCAPYWSPKPGDPSALTNKKPPKGFAPVEFHVHPWKASVIVDRTTIGEARDFNDETHPLWLSPGKHVVELRHPGYKTLQVQIEVAKGEPRVVRYQLARGEGVDLRD